MNSSNMVSKDRLEFDPVVPEFERRFYQKAYPNVNFVCERKVHCTVCKMHIGTAPSNESIIRMHPILRVTHCKKCHEFYNSGEFSKGEDGSELYCRWCGQGGEVYCCSNCPFVFCKSCIISNLSRGVVADIEQNENWSCFNCAPKMLWPLRAQHWALMRFIDKQKKAIINSSLSDAEIKVQMTKDRSLCCKAKKTTNYASDSSDSSNISLSKLKQKTGEKRSRKSLAKDDLSSTASPSSAKKVKSSNDEVVCTPDVMSMLEPECQLTVSSNTKAASQPVASSPKIMSIPQPSKNTPPPPQPIQIRPAPVPQVRAQTSTPVVKKTIVGPRLPSASSDFTTPVYHTINGYRIDLNSAAQQETVRLPNGKLIQVKRQGAGPQTVTTVQSAPSQPISPARIVHNTLPPTVSPITATVPTQQIVHSSGGHVIRTQLQAPRSITVQNPSIIPQFQQQTPQQYQQITIRQPNQQIATIRYQGAANQQVTNILQNGAVQLLNGATVTAVRPMPTLIKQFFPNTPLGFSRTQLQSQICSALDICQHLMGKVQTLTNSNAYKTAKSLVDVKELYIHLSYLLTYAIGRFKGLQDNCLSDMRELGFTADANSLENGQLAAGTDMVRSGKITDFPCVDLDQFHNLIVKNMGIMITAADSSTNDTSQELNTDVSGGNAEVENSDQAQVFEIIDDEDGNAFEREDERYEVEDSDDDCLLVQCGERKSDDELNNSSKHEPESDDEEEEDEEEVNDGNTSRPVFSTSYENDDDFRMPFVCGFTFEEDMRLIDFVKNAPELWDPDKRSINVAAQAQLWKQMSDQMPKGVNCRMRWKNLRYRYLVYKKRLDTEPSHVYVPPARHAQYLTFLDKVKLKQIRTSNAKGSPAARTKNVKTAPQMVTPANLFNADEYRFTVKLIRAVEKYPTLWHPNSVAVQRHMGQPDVWAKVYEELIDEGYKQASDAEEDEITIVEPKTDTINLDSDNEDDVPVSRPNNIPQSSMMAKNQNHIVAANHSVISGINNVTACNPSLVIAPVLTSNTTPNELPTEFDYSKITTNFLAGMLEVDLNECTNSAQVPKKPRKKTTNKPNPTLIKQKEMQERERLENMKKNDAKLKMQVQIALNKVEDIYEFAKPMIDGFKVNDEEKEATNSPLLEKADEKETIKEIDELLVPLDEKTEQDEKVEVIEKDEQPQTVDEKDPEKSPDESKSSEEDKDDPDDVVVVFVEDFENSKDAEPKNDGEDSDSVDMSEQVEIRETDLNPAQQEESLDSPEKEEKIEDEAAVESPKIQENEDEAEVLKSDEDDEDLSLREDLEAEVMMALKETAAENDAALKEAPKPMDVETDPLQDDDDKNLLVPMESQENMDTGLDDNLSTHSINFEGILGQTEVA